MAPWTRMSTVGHGGLPLLWRHVALELELGQVLARVNSPPCEGESTIREICCSTETLWHLPYEQHIKEAGTGIAIYKLTCAQPMLSDVHRLVKRAMSFRPAANRYLHPTPSRRLRLGAPSLLQLKQCNSY